VRGRLGNLSPEQEMAVEALSRGIVNKILHTPIRSLKSAAADPEITTLIESFRRLFDLQVKSPVTLEENASASGDDDPEQGS